VVEIIDIAKYTKEAKDKLKEMFGIGIVVEFVEKEKVKHNG
jgi:hypothetical protein